MKRYYLCLMMLLTSLMMVAQRELYFYDNTEATMKVKPVTGAEISFLPFYLTGSQNYDNRFSLSSYIGGFYEQPLTNSSLLRLSLGWHNIYYQTYDYANAQPVNGNIGISIDGAANHPRYAWRLQLEADPRWCLNFKEMHKKGKSHLNAGWFLGLPIQLQFTQIDRSQFRALMHREPTAKEAYKLYSNYRAAIGYRWALSHHSLLETKASAGLFVGNATKELSYGIQATYAYTF